MVGGRGAIWRSQNEAERIDPLAPGTALTIPLGTAFQFRAEAGSPLAFVAITMPPWPGMEEALHASGPLDADRRGRRRLKRRPCALARRAGSAKAA